MDTGLEAELAADDGVLEVARVLKHMDFPWMALPAGPRRWAPTDLSVEVGETGPEVARMAYRCMGDRTVVVAGARPDVDADALGERLTTPLLFAYFRRSAEDTDPADIVAAVQADPEWQDGEVDGWRVGEAGAGGRPARLAVRRAEGGQVVVAAHGVAVEEFTTILGQLEPLEAGSAVAAELHERHRRALAQRWWDVPRTPYTPEERD